MGRTCLLDLRQLCSFLFLEVCPHLLSGKECPCIDFYFGPGDGGGLLSGERYRRFILQALNSFLNLRFDAEMMRLRSQADLLVKALRHSYVVHGSV